MATLKKKIVVTIEGCDLAPLKAALGGESSHALMADLIWPRGAIAKKSSAQPCRLRQGALAEDVPWGERILFKEDVEGRFALRVSVSEATDGEALEEFLRSVAGTLIAATGELYAAELPGAPLRKMARAPVDYLAKQVGKMSAGKAMAEGMVDLAPKDISDGMRLTLPLKASATVYMTKKKMKRGRMESSKEAVVKKGDPCGEVTLMVEVL
ncbi:MAG: hypothetical protein FWF84_04115 [Kiritimatiellaeota bacterium]|nr:hypothetical protein [Kiritimatiellota bacterium]